MKIRPALLHDCDQIASLRKDTIRHVNSKDYPEEMLDQWSSSANVEAFTNNADSCKRWIAEDNDKIIGFCEHDLEGELSRIYVHKDYLRKGIGTALLKVAEDSLKQYGYNEIYIESTITAKDFYLKNGYRIIEQTTHPKDNACIYKMIKRLSDNGGS